MAGHTAESPDLMREKDVVITKLTGRGRPSVMVNNIPDVHNPVIRYALTLRELQVLQQRGQGLKIPEVAAALDISPNTVKAIISRAVDRNSSTEDGQRTNDLLLLLAADSRDLLSDETLDMLLGIAEGTISVEEDQDALRAFPDPTTIFS